MKMIGVLMLAAAFGFTTIGCDDDGNTDTNEPADTNGNGDAGDGDDTNQAGEAQTAGSCSMDGMFCITYECIGQSWCDALADAGPQACAALGEWSDSACTETDAVGMCRESDPDGDTITVHYADGMLDAAAAEEACAESAGTFTTP